MSETTPREEIDTFNHSHDVKGHPLQLGGFLDGQEPACPDCGRHVGGAKHGWQHARDCSSYVAHPQSIAGQADRHN